MKNNDAKKFIRHQFNRQSENFSSWSVTKNEEYAQAYFNFCTMTKGDRLLDVSCGSGEFCLFCAQRIAHATGVDLSDQMIALAQQQSKALSLANTTFLCGDAAGLPGATGSFSIVISKSAFHHYQEHDTIFREMKRCCSQKGKISVQDIIAWEDEDVDNFFESFEKRVDPSHKKTCSKKFIIDLYRRHQIDILSTFEITIDLELADYVNHAVRSKKDAVRLERLVETGLKNKKIKHYFYHKNSALFFKRNVFIVLGEK